MAGKGRDSKEILLTSCHSSIVLELQNTNLSTESPNLIPQEVIGNFIKDLYQERRKLTN